jgi:hypothetical protein
MTGIPGYQPSLGLVTHISAGRRKRSLCSSTGRGHWKLKLISPGPCPTHLLLFLVFYLFPSV